MLILGMRTDKPDAELYILDDHHQVDSIVWQAHRKLAETLHTQIRALFDKNQKSLDSLDGIVIYEGPGSFTGLRIGMSVANALSYSLAIPVIACGADSWLGDGIEKLLAGEAPTLALPHYGSSVHVTQPKR